MLYANKPTMNLDIFFRTPTSKIPQRQVAKKTEGVALWQLSILSRIYKKRWYDIASEHDCEHDFDYLYLLDGTCNHFR
jgi:hypothetical protein